MAIRVECLSCRSTFGVRDDFAGRRGKCPKCGSAVEVPAAPATPAATARPSPGRSRTAAVDVSADEDASGAYGLAGSARAPVKVVTKAVLDEGVSRAVGTTR